MKKQLVLILATLLVSACQKGNISPKFLASESSGATSKTDTSRLKAGTPTPITQHSPGVPTPQTLPLPTGAAAHLDGTYFGFLAVSPSATSVSSMLPVQLVFSGNQFEGADSQYLHYNVGYGTFTGDNKTLTFSKGTGGATTADPASNQGAQVSSALLGSYNFAVKGDSLFISKTLNGLIYTYKLKKQPLVPDAPVHVIPPPLTGLAAHLDGTYAGYCTGTIFALVNPTKLFTNLILSANQFDPGGSPEGSGSLTGDNNNLTFYNEAPVAGTDEDPDPFILQGTYQYTIKGDSLLLSKTYKGGRTISYKLKKQ